MKRVLGVMEQELKWTFTACGYEKRFAKVVLSNRPDLCEYQHNGAMAATKAYKKKPIDIASTIVGKLTGEDGHPIFREAAAVTPGFISLKLSEQLLSDYASGMAAGNESGLEAPEHPETVMVDYGGTNMTKPLHVGHLRAAIIGESIKRMERFLDHKMIDDAHLGDWGLQMGLVVEELRGRKPELVYFDQTYTGEFPPQAPFTISESERIYPTASVKSERDEAFRGRAHEATLKLQKRYPPYRATWQYIMTIPVEDPKKDYSNLNMEFDLWKGESDAEPYIGDMIQMLIDKELAYESQGALVVDVAEESDPKEIPLCPIRKPDGASLYATSDLATVVERERDFHPDQYTYVVDKRQGMYLEQVFRVAKKAGTMAQDTPVMFLRLDTMNGKDGKPFRTREGGVMRLRKLIDEIDGAAYVRIMGNKTMSREEAKTTSRVVGLAALKHGDLSNQAGKDYMLDTGRSASFEGNTGPYILYTVVCIKSILSKYRDNGGSVSKQVLEKHILPSRGELEKVLMLMPSKYNEVLENSFAETAPHKICQYIYELADVLNNFYHDTRILLEEGEARKDSYIGLITLIKRVLETYIGLLGTEALDHVQMTAEREHQSNEDYQDEHQ